MTWSLTHPNNESDRRAMETDTAGREDDPTPRGVIRAALEAAVPAKCVRLWHGNTETHLYSAAANSVATRVLDAGSPLRVLDVCAGYGSWASELRRLAGQQGWPVHITGVEICEARREYLERWCDEVWIDDWRESMRGVAEASDGGADIMIGNPHFTGLTGPKGAKLPPGECMPAVLLRHAPAVLLLHTQQAFLKSEAGRASWRANPPAASWLVPGGVKFRGPDVGADSRCYQVTLWLRGHEGPCAVHLLDDLGARDRAWVVAPGSELPSADLPAAPGWTQ